MVDSHCHLFLLEDNGKSDIESGKIEFVINVGYDRESIDMVLKFDHPKVFKSIGFHPHYADSVSDIDIQELLKYEKNIVAIGEIGLDFFKNFSSPKKQIEIFEAQIDIAKKLKKPIIVHSRNAKNETLEILKKSEVIGIMHCFTGDEDMMKKCVDMGFLISFSGIILRDKNLRDVVKKTPLQNISVETDAPFLPMKEKPNRPIYVKYVIEKISELKNIPKFKIEEITTENTKRFLFQTKNEN